MRRGWSSERLGASTVNARLIPPGALVSFHFVHEFRKKPIAADLVQHSLWFSLVGSEPT
jgi:hypothetical protein